MLEFKPTYFQEGCFFRELLPRYLFPPFPLQDNHVGQDDDKEPGYNEQTVRRPHYCQGQSRKQKNGIERMPHINFPKSQSDLPEGYRSYVLEILNCWLRNTAAPSALRVMISKSTPPPNNLLNPFKNLFLIHMVPFQVNNIIE